jgi:hypothetical protein
VYAYEAHWTQTGTVVCRGPEACEHCLAGKAPQFKAAYNFYVPDENAMKVAQGGITWFRDVIKVSEKYGLDNWSFEIERHGAKGDNKTSYSILPHQQIDAALRERLRRAPLHNLQQVLERDVGGEAAPGAMAAAVASQPVPLRVAQGIAERLRTLPRTDVALFLQTFKIARVRELQETDEPRALEFLGVREAAQQASTTLGDGLL